VWAYSSRRLSSAAGMPLRLSARGLPGSPRRLPRTESRGPEARFHSEVPLHAASPRAVRPTASSSLAAANVSWLACVPVASETAGDRSKIRCENAQAHSSRSTPVHLHRPNRLDRCPNRFLLPTLETPPHRRPRGAALYLHRPKGNRGLLPRAQLPRCACTDHRGRSNTDKYT